MVTGAPRASAVTGAPRAGAGPLMSVLGPLRLGPPHPVPGVEMGMEMGWVWDEDEEGDGNEAKDEGGNGMGMRQEQWMGMEGNWSGDGMRKTIKMEMGMA